MTTSSEIDLKTPAKNQAPAPITPQKSSQQLLPPGKFISHHPKAGLNPLVDAGAYLFSVIGKLKQLKSYRYVHQLQKELIEEVNQFQETAKTKGYSADFILVSRYALCATFDDIISTTPWGSQGQWESYRLQAVFNNNEVPNHERFFLILERIIKDPSLYIDLMEFMYICLSLGFKGNFRTTEFGNNQLEQAMDSLYKRIRSHHGNFSKALSPFPLRPVSYQKQTSSRNSLWGLLGITAGTILAIFIGLGYMLDSISNQAYQELMHIGKSILYENPESSS
jgi:type VI secretion system protein ImpK